MRSMFYFNKIKYKTSTYKHKLQHIHLSRLLRVTNTNNTILKGCKYRYIIKFITLYSTTLMTVKL